MPAIPGATELLPVPARGRRFDAERVVRLGDVDPRARMRLDAIARFLQDVATDDADDCGLDESLGWVVRRTLIDVHEAAMLGETVDLTTYCTGMGRSWAERTTTIRGADGASVESVSLWVQVSVETGRPTPLTEQFHHFYGEACGNRKVSARLVLDNPPAETERQQWAVRRTDLDPFNHVNNAANWSFLEEVIGATGAHRVGRAEMDFRAPIEFGSELDVLIDRSAPPACAAWLSSDGSVASAARWVPMH